MLHEEKKKKEKWSNILQNMEKHGLLFKEIWLNVFFKLISMQRLEQ